MRCAHLCDVITYYFIYLIYCKSLGKPTDHSYMVISEKLSHSELRSDDQLRTLETTWNIKNNLEGSRIFIYVYISVVRPAAIDIFFLTSSILDLNVIEIRYRAISGVRYRAALTCTLSRCSLSKTT